MKGRIICFFIAIGLIVTCSILRNQNINSSRENYITNLDLKFTGIVVDIDSIQQDGGIVIIDVKKSNKSIHEMCGSKGRLV